MTVLIVDGHALVRAAIHQVLSVQPEIKHVILAQHYAEAEQQTARLHPQIIWLDLQIAGGTGIEAIRRLRKLSPTSRLLALTEVEHGQEAFEAIMADARGYLSKQDVEPHEVMTVIRRISQGDIVLRPALMTHLVERLRAAALPLWGSESEADSHVVLRQATLNELEQLTAREREVLQLISQGHRDREIARGLYIAERTVQKHVQSILSKLGVQNRTEAAYLIHRRGVS
jgi:two-component system nitrate/nitrite response regulator NarL